MFADLRYSLRALAKHPSFSFVAILVLGLAVGVNTAVFSLINSLLLRPLPVRAPEELGFVYMTEPRVGFSGEYIPDLRERTAAVFSGLAYRGGDRALLRAGAGVLPLQGEAVSGNYFDVLGIAPRLGRGFTAAEDTVSADPVIVLSDSLWRGHFNADPAALGRTAVIDAGGGGRVQAWRAFTIIGVAPAGFGGTGSPWQPAQYWVLQRQRTIDRERIWGPSVRRIWGATPIGRLAAGVSFASAGSAVDAAGRDILSRSQERLLRPDQSFELSRSPRVTLPFAGAYLLSVPRVAGALMAVATLLLAVAAANLAGMLLARGISRRSEIAVRLSLGAGRLRLMRQLLMESLLLATGASLAGLIAARILITAATREIPQQLPGMNAVLLAIDVPLDGRVVLFAIVSCFVTAIVVGLAPAIAAVRTDLLSSLTSSGVVAPRHGKSRLRRVVLIPQISLSLVLLLVAGVLVRSLLRLELAPPGYETTGVVLAEVRVPSPQSRFETVEERTAETTRRREILERIMARVTALPGVSSAAVTGETIQGVGLAESGNTIIARTDYQTTNRYRGVTLGFVSPDYFKTMGIPLLRGRSFDARDMASPKTTAIVSERLAGELWPGKDPIGEWLAAHEPRSQYPPQWREVVGVVRSVSLPLDEYPRPVYYVPHEPLAGATFLVRGAGNPSELIAGVKQAVAQADDSAIVLQARPLADAVSAVLYPRRFGAALLGSSGLAALILAALGVFGLMSYAVAQRTGEIGVRMVLGAQRRDVIRLILSDGAGVLVAGLVIGFALAFAAIRYASHAIVPLPDTDAVTFIGVPVLLIAVVLLACYLPARRAARVDPLVVLRTS